MCHSNISIASGDISPIKMLHYPKVPYIIENTIRIPIKLTDRLFVFETTIFDKKRNFIIVKRVFCLTVS